MKNTETQNEEVSIDTVRKESIEGEVESRNDVQRRKKSGMCEWKTMGTAVFVFVVFVLFLGGIGFGVIWVLEHHLSWSRVEKPAMSEVIRSVDEKIVAKETLSDRLEDTEKTLGAESSSVSVQSGTSGDATKTVVLVLNAGGEKGSAGKVAETLKQSGYASAKAENASVFTYKNITIFYADEAFKGSADQIAAVLKKKYPIVTVSKATSADEKKEKVVVMVGE